MDYRKLLAKYIRHVDSCNHDTYLEKYRREQSGGIFSDEEWQELNMTKEKVSKLYELYDEKFAGIEKDVQNRFISLAQAVEYVNALNKELKEFGYFADKL